MNDADQRAADEFRAQCRRQLARPLEARMKYGWYRLLRPGVGARVNRVFPTTKAYREWCASHLPAYLGFQPAPTE